MSPYCETDGRLASSCYLHQNSSSIGSALSTVHEPMGRLLYLTLGVASLTILVGLVMLVYMMYKRRQTSRELGGGKCNLPTVVWRPRFMNYTSRDEGALEDFLDWDDDDVMMEWAHQFLEEHRSTQASDDGRGRAGTIQNNKKKMGSSAITNILPRMERLKGPYGMYATVYGIQTKVVHVAHPIPARAILTGAGVVEIGGMGDSLGGSRKTRPSFTFRNALHVLKNAVVGTGRPSTETNGQKRRRSSSLRMLTGSTKYPAYDHFKNFSGEGVFTANGSDWKAKRASVIHCLLRNGNTEQSLEMEANRAAEAFESEIAHAMKIVTGNEGGNEIERKSPVINVVPMLQRSTIGLIYRLITHHNVQFCPELALKRKCREREQAALDHSDSLTSSSPRSSAASLVSMAEGTVCQNEEAHGKQNYRCDHDEKEAQLKSLLPTYLQSVTEIRMIILAQSRSFWYLLPRWVYRAFSPMYREEERTMGPIREFAQLVCHNAVDGSPLALLGERASHSSGLNNPTCISKDLVDEAITLLFAGQDTSAATLSWTLHLLSLHPDKQERVANEVRSVLEKSGTEPIVKSMISQMPYLDAVIKESMRLYPVAPFIVRKLTTDITIPIDDESPTDRDNSNKTISMPASTFACIWIYALHRNPKLWAQPDEFLPERWIDPDLRSQDLGQAEYGSYMPFAIGPRNCLGQPLAQVILRIMLARILNKYVILDPKLEALKMIGKADEHDGLDPKCLRIDMQAGFTVLPSNGLRLQLMERHDA